MSATPGYQYTIQVEILKDVATGKDGKVESMVSDVYRLK